MPTLNINVNARTERAKRDLRALDKEITKISKSEVILEKALKKAGDVGAREFRKIQSAAVRQSRAVNTSALQFKQLRSQMVKLGASPVAIGKITSEFIRFRKEMERGVVGTTRFQKAQDRLKSVLATTKRQLNSTTTATKKLNAVAKKGKGSLTGLGHTLENLGSTAVLVAGPLSGIGSRLIAFGAIAKRGGLRVAGLFSAIAAAGVLAVKSINAFDGLNLSLAKTEAILKATGKAAHITAGFVEEVAAKIARQTLADVEDTRPAAAGLLSFRGIDASNLERVLGLAQDIAAVRGTDLSNSIKMLGRASEDPIASLTTLRRLLGEFTPLQKDYITNLQNMGRGTEAFGAILDIAEDKMGGAGEGENTGIAGGLDRLGQAWTHLMESLGSGPLYNLAVGTIERLADVLDLFAEKVDKFGGAYDKLAKSLQDTKTLLSGLASEGFGKIAEIAEDQFSNLGQMILDSPLVKNLTGAAREQFGELLVDLVNDGNKFSKEFKGMIEKLIPEFKSKEEIREPLVITVNAPSKEEGHCRSCSQSF